MNLVIIVKARRRPLRGELCTADFKIEDKTISKRLQDKREKGGDLVEEPLIDFSAEVFPYLGKDVLPCFCHMT